jgi:hypothetical protein
MILDGGAIRGGFAANFEARIIPPQDSVLVRKIGEITGAARCPKVDIEITGDDRRVWTLSLRGTPQSTSLVTIPKPHILGVATSAGFYSVNIQTREVRETLPGFPIDCAASDLIGGTLFLAACIKVTAFDEFTPLWQSRRISLDGIKMLCYANGFVKGVGTGLGSDGELKSVPFTIDARSGETRDGFTDWD